MSQSDREFASYLNTPIATTLQPIVGCNWRDISAQCGLTQDDVSNIEINSGLEIQTMLCLLWAKYSWAGMKTFASSLSSLKLTAGYNVLLHTPYVSGFGI